MLDIIDTFRSQSTLDLCFEVSEDKMIYRCLLNPSFELPAIHFLIPILTFAQAVQELPNYAFNFIKLKNSVDSCPLWIERKDFSLLVFLLFLVNIQIHFNILN